MPKRQQRLPRNRRIIILLQGLIYISSVNKRKDYWSKCSLQDNMKTLSLGSTSENAANNGNVGKDLTSSNTTTTSQRRRTVSFTSGKIDWHKDISYAVKSGRFETVRGHLSLQLSVSSNTSSESNRHDESHKNGSKGGFWSRLSGLSFIDSSKDSTGLLTLDEDGRTPLHVALTSRRTPPDVILSMIRVEPKAVAVANGRGRFPLHFAVVHKQHIKVIAELIDTFPAALSAQDTKDMSPLAYALDGARRETNLSEAPSTFWMPVTDDSVEARWQEEQGERWGIVHWLLLSSATYPQTSLSVGGKKPMLVDALIYAAPPAVISLLIGASVVLLSHANRATAFAGSTLYSCIARHYPLTILMSLVSQCPKDVHKVRDETGMGLISSQFISGCFKQNRKTHEWSVSGALYSTLLEAIDDEFLRDDDLAFLDWWKKIEYLIAFSTGVNNPEKFPKNHLLHAALKNIDTPPLVVRMLLALYPQSIQLLDQETLAHPLYIAASRPEYIPRKYEVEMCGRESILEIVLSHEKRLINKRHELRLPIHAAIGSGRVYSDYRCLVTSRPEFLLQRDPETGLYPFLQAAAVRQKLGHFRLACVARNKYSYAEWTNMSDLEKANAIQQVTEEEDRALFESIYQLLRLEPSVVERLHILRRRPPIEGQNMQSTDMVSSHFIFWLYEENEMGKWITNETHSQLLQKILDGSVSLAELPAPWESWWAIMKDCIRECCPNKLPNDNRKLSIPGDDDQYLLHAALLNCDTPPPVVSILLTFYPLAASMCLPGTSLLPLHIAAWTTNYASRSFEICGPQSLELVSIANPDAASKKADGFLPLHIAIRSGKNWSCFRELVNVYPESMYEKDPITDLYPFQLVAMDRDMTPNLRCYFQRAARNKYGDSTWKALTPFHQSKQIRQLQQKNKRAVLDTLFEMLRKSASIVENLMNSTVEKGMAFDVQPKVPVFAQSQAALTALESNYDDKGGWDTSENETFADGTEFSDDGDGSVTTATHSVDDTSSILQRRTQSLMKHLTRSKSQRGKADVFECDTSVLSNVDVLSVMSSSLHTGRGEHAQRTASQRRLMGLDSGMSAVQCQEGSQSESDFGGSDHSDLSYVGNEESSSTAEFAEESLSDIKVSDMGGLKDGRGDDGYPPSHSRSKVDPSSDDNMNEDEDEDLIVTFIVRRQPRFKTRNDRDVKLSVKLSKKTNRSELSFSAHGKPTIGADAQRILQASSHSVSSYRSMDTEAKNKLQEKKGQLWTSNQLTQYNNALAAMNQSLTESSGVTFQDPTEGSLEDDIIGTKELLLGALDDSEEVGLPIATPSLNKKKSNMGGLSRSTSDDRQQKLPGIAAYLSSSKSQLTKGKEDTSVFSNTPSTLSFLADGSQYAEASTDRSSVMATDIDNTSFSNSFNDLNASDPCRLNPDGSFSSGTRALDVSATFSIPEDNEEVISEQDKGVSSSSSQTSTEGPTTPHDLSITWTRNSTAVARKTAVSSEQPILKADLIAMDDLVQISELENKQPSPGEGRNLREVDPIALALDKKAVNRVIREDAEAHHAVIANAEVQHGNASLSVKTGNFQQNQMYFDKKAMRWRVRSDASEGIQSPPIVDILKPSQTSKQSHSTRPSKSPRVGMPFVDVMTRDEIKRRNANLMMRGVQKTKTPSNRELRSQWRHMFDVAEKKLGCLLCDNNSREVLMVPCRHLAICRKCSSKNKHISSCPLCSKPSTDRMILFQ
ncbi:hypothetical protein FisN_14Lh319 [Fistulifera solaris]|uniref:RING-type domain-containing protein n=1 Tax=Fistulifera solaris TaxID=1519565 RepID=A0A1Z5JI30_FISSO|nr:hypothetical protein FisN_14Lh319 [Fistulifera solaris]|eukprot:GAX13665.1 hypothetical protein FisN_14Lh319 [Fistulifera solaris]